MQREIKYRGKSIDKEWVYGFLIASENKNKWYIVEYAETDASYGEETDLYNCGWYEVIPETVGQYTGLPDKNSKEIYEGDIISDGVQKWVVEYDKTSCGFIAVELVNKRLDYSGCFSLYHLANRHNQKRDVKIIGNIYDNPELLQEPELLRKTRQLNSRLQL